MKQIAASFVLLSVIFALTACAPSHVLTEEDAAETIRAVSRDPEPYFGHSFEYTGILVSETVLGETYRYVLIEGANGENLGFEIRFDGTYPDNGTKVSVCGVLTAETVYGQKYIYLKVSELIPAPERE